MITCEFLQEKKTQNEAYSISGVVGVLHAVELCLGDILLVSTRSAGTEMLRERSGF